MALVEIFASDIGNMCIIATKICVLEGVFDKYKGTPFEINFKHTFGGHFNRNTMGIT